MQRLLKTTRVYSLALLLALTLFAQAAHWLPPTGRAVPTHDRPSALKWCPGEGEGDTCP